MSKNISEIPFTELVERTSELASERANVYGKIRGIVNDVYTREIPRKEDWNFLLAQSTITTVAEYTVGTVSANTGSNTLSFTSATMDSSMVGSLIKISGNDYVYTIQAMLGTTGLTIQPPLSGSNNVSSASYSIFEPFYSLASDFDRFPKNGGLINYSGSKEQVIPEEAFQNWSDDYTASTRETPSKCRLFGVDTAGNTMLELNPPPKINKSFPYWYFTKLAPMRETTAGLVSVNSSSNTVFGINTQFAVASTGWFFRINDFGRSSDSEWYRVLAINGTALTLQTVFGLSGATSASYTLCSAPQMPSKMHPAILYGSLLQTNVVQDDPMFQSYNVKYAEVLSDGKRLYKTRIYSQDISSIAEEYLYRQ